MATVVRRCRWRDGPMQLTGDQAGAVETWMIAALRDDQRIVGEVLADDIPRRVAGITDAADAQALTLAEGVIHQPRMLSDVAAFQRADGAGLRRQIALQEVAELALADKTDAGAVLLGVVGEAGAGGQFAHLVFVQCAEREQCAAELLLVEQVQEVALILVGSTPLYRRHAPS